MESGQCLVMFEPTSLMWCYFSDWTLLNLSESLKFYAEKLYLHFHCVVVTLYGLFWFVCLFFFFWKLVGQYKEFEQWVWDG